MRSGTSEKIPLNWFGESSKTLRFFRIIFQLCHITLKHSILFVGPGGFFHNRVASEKFVPPTVETHGYDAPPIKEMRDQIGVLNQKKTLVANRSPKFLKKEETFSALLFPTHSWVLPSPCLSKIVFVGDLAGELGWFLSGWMWGGRKNLKVEEG